MSSKLYLKQNGEKYKKCTLANMIKTFEFTNTVLTVYPTTHNTIIIVDAHSLLVCFSLIQTRPNQLVSTRQATKNAMTSLASLG